LLLTIRGWKHLRLCSNPMQSFTNIKLVVFDMDGTLTVPYLDFSKIRKEIGVPGNTMLTLDYILTLEGEEKELAYRKLLGFEKEAAEKAELQPGAEELLYKLHEKGIHIAVQTRNSQASASKVFDKFKLPVNDLFTRENAPPKPDPAAINSLLEKYHLEKSEVIMVGDFWADIETGQNAGVKTVLIRSWDLPEADLKPDAEIHNLNELPGVMQQW
jgi:HAD superfamily hydrolase (TIGR01509 family)